MGYVEWSFLNTDLWKVFAMRTADLTLNARGFLLRSSCSGSVPCSFFLFFFCALGPLCLFWCRFCSFFSIFALQEIRQIISIQQWSLFDFTEWCRCLASSYWPKLPKLYLTFGQELPGDSCSFYIAYWYSPAI